MNFKNILFLIYILPLVWVISCGQDNFRSGITVTEIPNTDDSGGTVCKKSAQLSWAKPTQNTDGSSLTNLAGYKIYYGTGSLDYSSVVDLYDPNLTSYQITELVPGNTYYFSIKSINASGVTSDYASEVSLSLPACL